MRLLLNPFDQHNYSAVVVGLGSSLQERTYHAAQSAVLKRVMRQSFKLILHSLVLLSIGLVSNPVVANSDREITPLEKPRLDNLAELQLGRDLFHDPRLSRTNNIACASCHNISEGGDDGMATSTGVYGRHSLLNAPSVFNSVNDLALFWDGRTSSMLEHVAEPLHNPLEMDSDWPSTIAKLNKDQQLVERFRAIYKQPISGRSIATAIAAYQAKLITYDSPFDRFLRGDNEAITEKAKQGFLLFRKNGCISCHQGQNIGGNMYQKLGVTQAYFKPDQASDPRHLGRFNVTGLPRDKFKFKVPSLRNVAETAPYLHDGSIESLSKAVKLMAEHQLGIPIDDAEVASIVAFLESLTGQIPEELL